MTTTTYRHPTANPVSLRIDHQFPGQIEVEVVNGVRAEIDITTADTSGAAADAVRATRITNSGDMVSLTVPAPSGGSGFGYMNVSGATVVVGNMGGGTVIVNGRVIADGAASNPVNIKARIPAASALSVTTGSASLILAGAPLARLDFDAGSGSLDGACCDVLDARTGSGDIRVRAVANARVKAGSGDIVIDMAGTVTARTGSGDVRLNRCEGPAQLSTGSGDVWAPATADARTGSGRVRIIEPGGRR